MCRNLFLNSQGCTFFCWGVCTGTTQGATQSLLRVKNGARKPRSLRPASFKGLIPASPPSCCWLLIRFPHWLGGNYRLLINPLVLCKAGGNNQTRGKARRRLCTITTTFHEKYIRARHQQRGTERSKNSARLLGFAAHVIWVALTGQKKKPKSKHFKLQRALGTAR